MRGRKQSPDIIVLRRLFKRWAAIVELFARRRPARKRVEAKAYVRIHRELIASCRVQAASANEVEAAFFRYMEDLAQPWLDLAVLGRADRDILFDLLIRCRHINVQLGGRSWTPLQWNWEIPAVLGTLFFAIMLLCMSKFSVGLSTILDYARGWSDDLWFSVARSSELQRLTVIGCVLVVVAMIAVSRTARS
jgi:hypothetical protein